MVIALTEAWPLCAESPPRLAAAGVAMAKALTAMAAANARTRTERAPETCSPDGCTTPIMRFLPRSTETPIRKCSHGDGPRPVSLLAGGTWAVRGDRRQIALQPVQEPAQAELEQLVQVHVEVVI